MVGWRISLWVAVVIVALFFLYLVRGILLPFIFAAIITALLDPPVRKLRLYGFSRALSVSFVFIGFFALTTLAVVYLAPLVISELTEFKDRLEFFTTELSAQSSSENIFTKWNPVHRTEIPSHAGPIDWLLSENKQFLEKLGVPTTKRALMEQYVEPYRAEIVRVVHSFFSGFIGIISSVASQLLLLILTPLLVFMMLIDLEKFKVQGASWIPSPIRTDTLAILRDIGKVFFGYLNGVVIVIALYMIVMSVVLTALQVPYSILLAILSGALYLIPYVGPWISVSAVFLITSLSGIISNWIFGFTSPWVFAAMVSGIFMLVSITFDQIIYPRVIGRSVGLHPIISMFVIFSGGALFGLLGMILSFPLAGAIKVILERVIKLTTIDHIESVHLPAIPLRHRISSEI